jgi:diacylglycerol kinase
MAEKKRWSIFLSFGCALHGIYIAFRDERNMRIHGLLTLLVLAAMFFLKVSVDESLILLFNIGLVLVAELINSAIEESFDLQMKAQHPQVKVGKDIAAGAVLVASITAFISGCVILIPKIWNLLQ